MNRAELIRFLQSTSSYAHSPKSVSHIQTHASDVFIASPYVYKVKKPEDFGFLDFSTLEKRKFYLDNELRLNRRLTEGIYLEILEISERSGIYSFGPGENVAEYVLKMKELPGEYFLKNLLENKKASEPEFERISEKLVRFYNTQPKNAKVQAFGNPDRIKPDVIDNIQKSREYVHKTLSLPALKTLEFYNEAFFAQKKGLLEKRVNEGFIKDCHGDLHIEHINLSPDRVNIYDCIEFNERFRYIDTASDTAFLAMDLDYNGYREFSRFFISRVSALMPDKGIYTVLDFYKCYRAAVRGKVLSIKAHEDEVPTESRQDCLEKARRYFSLALKYSVLGSSPSLIVCFGSIGSGKSTLSQALSEELSCPSLSSDLLRKKCSGADPFEKQYEPYGEGIYSEDVTKRVYAELTDKALTSVSENGCAIIDASFSKQRWRDYLRDEAAKKNIPLYFIQTKAPSDIIRSRLLNREQQGGSVSDGRLSILEQFTKDFEEPLDEEPMELITVDTTKNMEEIMTETLKKLSQINLDT